LEQRWLSDQNQIVRVRKIFAEQTKLSQALRGHEMGVVDDGDEHFAGAMDFEGLLDQEAFATVVVTFKLDLEGLAKDAQGVVISVKGPVDHGCDHPFWIVLDEALFEDAFAGAWFSQEQAEAALLGVDAKDVEDFLLVGEQRDGLRVEGMALQTKMGTNHKKLMS